MSSPEINGNGRNEASEVCDMAEGSSNHTAGRSRRLGSLREKVKKSEVADKLINSNGLVFTFLRSAVSSQAASWIDMGMSFVLFAWVGLGAFLSTAIGAFLGGVVNCVINYKFTFHAEGTPWRAVVVKYALVWTGSLLLNAYGTELLYRMLNHMTWLKEIGFRPNGYFAAARLLVSLLVSWFWNFLLQRNFVYRPSGFDRYAVRFVDAVTFRNHPAGK
ncbi:MAG: GtrA family protein [Muribaculaceae bacterium]|nr:GtrA family protein [Muribaculaceae bacterium]MDE7081758.1 GtrA family protein [Muribaculaceae bacterium]